MAKGPIFISYSRRDEDFAIGLAKKLEDLGATIWIDQSGIDLGTTWDDSIDDAIDSSSTLLLLISSTSAASRIVNDEVSAFLEVDKQIVPILIEQCDLPFRWKRINYADYTDSPEKAMKRVLGALGFDESNVTKFQDLSNLLWSGNGEEGASKAENLSESEPQPDDKLGALLISEPEIDRAAEMHKKGIKKGWMMIGFVAVCSLALMAILFIFFKDTVQPWMAITGPLLINLLSIKQYGGITKRSQNIELIELLKLKRDRLIRYMNKLTENEVEGFNEEFDKYITI